MNNYTVKQVKVDYLAFTLPIGDGERPVDNVFADEAINLLVQYAPDALTNTMKENQFLFRAEKGRRPYKTMYRFKEQGLSIFCGGQSNVLYEYSGMGCDFLRSIEQLESTAFRVRDRLTRIDVAIDINDAPDTAALQELIGNGRAKTNGVYNSPTGSTIYVGSRRSLRYMRIYRFAPPHPRSDTTRIEVVFRKAQATALGNTLNDIGIEGAAQQTLNLYKFSGIEPVHANAGTITIPRAQRENAGTVRWLITQCAPAFRRMVQAGEITNPDTFFREHFLKSDDDDSPQLEPGL